METLVSARIDATHLCRRRTTAVGSAAPPRYFQQTWWSAGFVLKVVSLVHERQILADSLGSQTELIRRMLVLTRVTTLPFRLRADLFRNSARRLDFQELEDSFDGGFQVLQEVGVADDAEVALSGIMPATCCSWNVSSIEQDAL